MDRKKVLVVEDDRTYHRAYELAMGDRIEFVQALTIEQGEALFAEHSSDFDAIVMDACVPGDKPTTEPLVRKFRESFAGPMIAVSSLEEYRQKLVAAGCDHSVPKWDLADELPKILGL